MRNLRRACFTLIELLMVGWFLICAAGGIALIWVICHFIAKFW